MLRIRPGIARRFRNVTEEEYALLAEAADERASLQIEDRGSYRAPEAADASIVGAVLWSTFVLWQDHPTFLALGFAGGVISIIARVFDNLK